jgi:hypothetical protein
MQALMEPCPQLSDVAGNAELKIARVGLRRAARARFVRTSSSNASYRWTLGDAKTDSKETHLVGLGVTRSTTRTTAGPWQPWRRPSALSSDRE